jgi:hypothetical protein
MRAFELAGMAIEYLHRVGMIRVRPHHTNRASPPPEIEAGYGSFAEVGIETHRSVRTPSFSTGPAVIFEPRDPLTFIVSWNAPARYSAILPELYRNYCISALNLQLFKTLIEVHTGILTLRGVADNFDESNIYIVGPVQ